jgi:hypothetical protein
MKCINSITPLMVLLKKQGAYTESNQYKPQVNANLLYQPRTQLLVEFRFKVQVDTI